MVHLLSIVKFFHAEWALQAGILIGSPLGKLFVALVAAAVVLLVGRFVLAVAWKLVSVAAVVVGVLLLLSLFLL